MATTTWHLSNVEYDISDGFCHTAHYSVVRTDGTDPVYTANNYGSVALKRPETLKARTDLKTADLVADVKGILGPDEVKIIEESLVQFISEQKTPTKGEFLPES